MSVHKSTFWGPFFALVAFTICVGVIKSVDEWTEKRAAYEMAAAVDSMTRAYDDSIKVIGDSIRRAEFVKDSTTNVIQRAANRQRTKVEQCKMWAWSDTANFGNEEQAERDCIRRNNGN